jgi:hypothetical protein
LSIRVVHVDALRAMTHIGLHRDRRLAVALPDHAVLQAVAEPAERRERHAVPLGDGIARRSICDPDRRARFAARADPRR